MKKTKLLLSICLAIFLLNSCTEEKEYLENNNRDLKFEQKSFKELILLKDFNNAYQRVKTEKQKNVTSRSALEEQYNFTIKESEDVKIVEVDNKKFYNILIERDSASASYFENLVFMVEKINNQDEISAYILKYGTPNGYIQPKTFTAVLVTAHGTKYALKITDVYNFKTFCQSYFNGWENPSVEKIIEDKHELLNNIRIKNSNTVNEESFAKFLSKNNVGMSFLKCTNDNFTEWSEIVVQSNGLVESYPCNN